MRRQYLFAFLILVLLLSSCKIKKSPKDEKFEARGTDAIVMNYLKNFPQDSIRIGDKDKEIRLAIELRNKGIHPERGSVDGKLFIGGFDKGIIQFSDLEASLNDKFLDGRSSINKLGGYEVVEFKGNIVASRIPTDKFSVPFSTTTCYRYKTLASISACIDADPYGEEKVEKVCIVKPITLTSQGAPVAVTKIEEEVLSDKIQFSISIKNMGGGDVLNSVPDDKGGVSTFAPEHCNPYNNQIRRENFDLVRLESIKLSNKEIKDDCRPTRGNYVRLIEGEGFFICSVEITEDMRKQVLGYTTPLEITLDYVYRNVLQKNVDIVKVK